MRLSSVLSRGWVCEAEYQWEAYGPKQALNQGSEPEEELRENHGDEGINM